MTTPQEVGASVSHQLDFLLRQSFPELSGFLPRLHFVVSHDFIAACRVSRRQRALFLDLCFEDFQRMTTQEREGCLAHELCHVVSDLRPWAWLSTLLYPFWPAHQTKLERATDLEVIARGYGPSLLAFQRYHDRHYEAYTEQDGLTTHEIQTLLAHRSHPR